MAQREKYTEMFYKDITKYMIEPIQRPLNKPADWVDPEPEEPESVAVQEATQGKEDVALL